MFNTKDISYSHLFLLVLIGFIAVQRFTLPILNAHVCVVTYIFFVYFFLKKENGYASAYILLSLYYCVDLGVGSYELTNSIFRKTLYASSLLYLLYFIKPKIKIKNLYKFLVLIVIVSLGSTSYMYNENIIFDLRTFNRDIFIMGLIFIVLLQSREIELNNTVVFYGVFGSVLGEITNILFFYSVSEHGYLSYNSLKVLVVLPCVFYFQNGKSLIIKILLLSATIYIYSFFGSRMLMMSLILLLIFFIVSTSLQNGYLIQLFLTVFLFFLVISYSGNITDFLLSDSLIKYKSVSFLGVLIENIKNSDFLVTLEDLDPVRLAEHQLFLSRSIGEIILGSGLGSGIYDENGILTFLSSDQSAFNDKEIGSSTYHNLHDFWIDFGLRFGTIVVVYIMSEFIFKLLWKKNKYEKWKGVIFGMLLINTTFSSAGVIFTVLFMKIYNSKK